MRGRLIYVTGIPGTGVKNALDKYVAWRCRRGGRAESLPEVISLEHEYLLPLLRPEWVELFGGAREVAVSDLDILDVLQLPKKRLKQGWSEAFCQAAEAATSVMDGGRDVLLTFHAAYYYVENHEYLCCLDFDLLAEQRDIAGPVITLTDDIYDVRARLSDSPRGVFSYRLSELSDLDDLLKLQQILDWRQIEKLVSERLSDFTKEKKHFLFATKHPIQTLDDLLYSEKKVVYLAHPISEVRRQWARGGTQAKDANEVASELSRLTAALRNSVTLLEPTTVDELRFTPTAISVTGGSGETSETILPGPPLTPRWPSTVTPEDILWTPVAKEPTLFRSEGSDDAARPPAGSSGASEVNGADAEVRRQRAYLVKYLEDGVRNQIKSRDFALVEQADALVAFRPVYAGNASGGVRSELDFHERLEAVGQPRATALILHYEEDEMAFGRISLRRFMLGWVRDGTIDGSAAAVHGMSGEELDAAVTRIRSARSNRQAGEILARTLADHGLGIVAPMNGALGDAQAITHRKEQETLGGHLRAQLVSHVARRVGAKGVTVIQDRISATEFAERVAQALV